MNILLTATALAIAMIVVPLAVIVIGIHRQEHAGLATRRAGACAAIARKVLALHAAPPNSGPRPPHTMTAPDQGPRRMAADTRGGADAARRSAASLAGARP